MFEADTSLYARAGGFDALFALCRRWHALWLQDPVAAHPFEHQLRPHHDERLAAYMAEALGGPALYTAGYGDESAVQRIHAGNGVHPELDEACLVLFDRALADVGIQGETAKRISSYFRAATEAQRAYSDSEVVVPEDLPFNYAAPPNVRGPADRTGETNRAGRHPSAAGADSMRAMGSATDESL